MGGVAFKGGGTRVRQPHDAPQLRRWTTFALSKLLFNHAEDSERLAPIREAVARGDDLGSRSTCPLHLTGSAVALDAGAGAWR